MSLLAITRPLSPESIPFEDDFDTSLFAFLQSPPDYDFMNFNSPPPNKDDAMTSFQEAGIKTEKERNGQEDVPMAPSGDEVTPTTSTPFRMQTLSLDETNTHEGYSTIDLFGHHNVDQQYNLSSSYPTTAPLHNYHFHPYMQRDYSNAMRNRSTGSPVRPLSPPLTHSPLGSGGSHHHPLPNSPNLVSPMSTIAGSPMSADTSPGSIGFHYQLPYNGTPLSNIGSLANVSPHAGPGMNMVAGFPYPTMGQGSPAGPGAGAGAGAGGGGKAMRPRMSRGPTSRSVQRRRVDDDDDSDIDDGPSGGLGFTPAAQDGDDRIPVSNKREDIRKARIESEQGADKSKRRRDELREGFRRLKEILPQTTQRASKSSLLDRSVAHIQSIEAANRYLVAQLETATRELEKLRNTNTELVRAVANSRGSNSPPNPNSGRV